MPDCGKQRLNNLNPDLAIIDRYMIHMIHVKLPLVSCDIVTFDKPSPVSCTSWSIILKYQKIIFNVEPFVFEDMWYNE